MLREERFLDALSLALTFYNGTAKAVVGWSAGVHYGYCLLSVCVAGLDGDRAVQQAAVVDQVSCVCVLIIVVTNL